MCLIRARAVTLAGIYIAMFADSAGAIGALLGSAEATTGMPPVNTATPYTWVSVGGLSIPVTASTYYWLAALGVPTGRGATNFPDGTAGTHADYSTETTMANLSGTITWNVTTAGAWPFYATGTPDTGGPTQNVLPASDVTTTGWTPSTGTTLFGTLADGSDATYDSATLA